MEIVLIVMWLVFLELLQLMKEYSHLVLLLLLEVQKLLAFIPTFIHSFARLPSQE
jgi:hypothetical protein